MIHLTCINLCLIGLLLLFWETASEEHCGRQMMPIIKVRMTAVIYNLCEILLILPEKLARGFTWWQHSDTVTAIKSAAPCFSDWCAQMSCCFTLRRCRICPHFYPQFSTDIQWSGSFKSHIELRAGVTDFMWMMEDCKHKLSPFFPP